MTRLVVEPGICGMETRVEVGKISKGRLRILVNSPCEMIAAMTRSLRAVDPYDAVKRFGGGEIQRVALNCHLHATCPVPMAILKAIEVEAGLALPRDIVIRFEDTSSD
jgi:hypothetical protein